MTSNRLNYIIQIDGLRCFAVLGVLISHFILFYSSNQSIKELPFGSGVYLFYLISGYLITKILLLKNQEIKVKATTFKREIKNFFVKRILRIFPLYYITIAFILVFNYNDTQRYFIYLVTYTTNIYMTLYNTYIGNASHLWSLAVEEQFYLLWPFIIFFLNRKYIPIAILFLVFSSLLSKFFFLNNPLYEVGANAFLTSCFDSLGLGALLAYLQLYHIAFFEKLLNKKIIFFLVISYVVFFLFSGFLDDKLKPMFNSFYLSLIYFFIVGIGAQNKFCGITKYLLENNVSIYLGKISYGIYIIHNFMPEIFNNILPQNTEHYIKVFFWVCSTLILATLSWYFIEKPFLRLKKKFY